MKFLHQFGSKMNVTKKECWDDFVLIEEYCEIVFFEGKLMNIFIYFRMFNSVPIVLENLKNILLSTFSNVTSLFCLDFEPVLHSMKFFMPICVQNECRHERGPSERCANRQILWNCHFWRMEKWTCFFSSFCWIQSIHLICALIDWNDVWFNL